MSEWMRVTPSAAARAAKNDGRRTSLNILVIAAEGFADADDTTPPEELLGNLATVLRRTVRQADIIHRIAADRFSLQVQGSPSAGVLRLAQRLQTTVATQRKSGAVIPANISIGIARQADGIVTVPELLRRADEAATEAMADQGNSLRFYELVAPASESPVAQAVSDRVWAQLRLMASRSGGAKGGREKSRTAPGADPTLERAPVPAISSRYSRSHFP